MSTNRKDIRKKPAIGGRGGRLNDTSKIIEGLHAKAKRLSARARANKREAAIVLREVTKLEAGLERLVVMIGGTTSVTIRRVRSSIAAVPVGVVKKGDFSGRRRRRNRRGEGSTTSRACEAARVHGHKDGNWKVAVAVG
jgi:hypothetical protein